MLRRQVELDRVNPHLNILDPEPFKRSALSSYRLLDEHCKSFVKPVSHIVYRLKRDTTSAIAKLSSFNKHNYPHLVRNIESVYNRQKLTCSAAFDAQQQLQHSVDATTSPSQPFIPASFRFNLTLIPHPDIFLQLQADLFAYKAVVPSKPLIEFSVPRRSNNFIKKWTKALTNFSNKAHDLYLSDVNLSPLDSKAGLDTLKLDSFGRLASEYIAGPSSSKVRKLAPCPGCVHDYDEDPHTHVLHWKTKPRYDEDEVDVIFAPPSPVLSYKHQNNKNNNKIIVPPEPAASQLILDGRFSRFAALICNSSS